MTVDVPQVRKSDFYPSALDKGMRSDRALKTAIAEMYVQGVSTRRVKKIIEKLCGFEVSSAEVSRCSAMLDDEIKKWRSRPLGHFSYVIVNALYEKVRLDGAVTDAAILVAYRISDEGKREALGTSVSLSEAHWRNFLDSLCDPGLKGVKMFISDALSDLKKAMAAVFSSVAWQRCHFHRQQNAQSYVSKKRRKPEVAEEIRSIFNAQNEESAKRLLGITIKKYADTESKLRTLMEDNIPESLTVFKGQQEHRKKLRTSNMPERFNKEIRGRTKIAGVFAHDKAAIRLISALLMEINEDWMTEKQYLKSYQ